mmetsp:Transcript_17205/g.35752  ORF Transcript_17205/g.35752 Transcript_17205/m.35752 type:complete len:122 (+) Transcript_17205:1024-1389(+)
MSHGTEQAQALVVRLPVDLGVSNPEPLACTTLRSSATPSPQKQKPSKNEPHSIPLQEEILATSRSQQITDATYTEITPQVKKETRMERTTMLSSRDIRTKAFFTTSPQDQSNSKPPRLSPF